MRGKGEVTEVNIMKRILISTSSFGEYDHCLLDNLRKKKCEIILNPYGRTLTESEIKELLIDIDGLIAGTEPLTQNVIGSAKNLKVISRCGIGIDNIDIEAVNVKGIKLYRTTEGPAIAVAELTLGLMLDSLRKISYLSRKICSGGWEKKMGRLLTAKTLGIVGMGTIGKKLTILLRPFNCTILAKDIFPDSKFSIDNNVQYVDLDVLLSKSDITTLHLPLDNNTRGLFTTDLFAQMKSDAVFINTSRGEIVDEGALYDALKEGLIGHACLDVYRNEPYNGRLREMDNVTLTCHIGSYAKEARIAMERQAVENLLKGFRD